MKMTQMNLELDFGIFSNLIMIINEDFTRQVSKIQRFQTFARHRM